MDRQLKKGRCGVWDVKGHFEFNHIFHLTTYKKSDVEYV